MFKKIVAVGILAVMVLSVAGCGLGSCGDTDKGTYPKLVEGDVWTYYIGKNGNIALIGVNHSAISEDGVLYIPAKVDGHKVTGFMAFMKDGSLKSFNVGMDLQKIIVADGVKIDYEFWFHARLYELEAKNPEGFYFASVRRNIIVPDGCREAYMEVITKQYGGAKQFCILEKSESLDTEWVVDDDGLLKGYFGLDGENYVLPSGIKKLDAASFRSGSERPKTITLNEDLEEIGKYGVRFGVDEIKIPQSVKFIDTFGVSAKNKIYLYRDTVCAENAFFSQVPPQLIYLD